MLCLPEYVSLAKVPKDLLHYRESRLLNAGFWDWGSLLGSGALRKCITFYLFENPFLFVVLRTNLMQILDYKVNPVYLKKLTFKIFSRKLIETSFRKLVGVAKQPNY
uniref:Uncharacterized protein n=1 Tax=Cacopsylla melanoneura TaxID=428564 RepID=A0A8D8W3U7_9HEMI